MSVKFNFLILIQVIVISILSAFSNATQSALDNAKKVYHLPLKGAFGTEITNDTLKEIINDIVKVQPDLVLIELDQPNVPWHRLLKSTVDQYDLSIYNVLEPMAEIRQEIQTRIISRGIPVHVYLRSGWGISSLLFITFEPEHTSIHPDGSIAGLGRYVYGHEDENINAKFKAAAFGGASALARWSKRSGKFISGLMWSDLFLSCTPKGQGAEWFTDNPQDPNGTVGEILLGPAPAINHDLAVSLGVVSGSAMNINQAVELEQLGSWRFLDPTTETKVNEIIITHRDNFKKDWSKFWTIKEVDLTGLPYTARNENDLRLKEIRYWESLLKMLEKSEAIQLRARQQLGLTLDQVRVKVKALKNNNNSNTGGSRGGGRGMG